MGTRSRLFARRANGTVHFCVGYYGYGFGQEDHRCWRSLRSNQERNDGDNTLMKPSFTPSPGTIGLILAARVRVTAMIALTSQRIPDRYCIGLALGRKVNCKPTFLTVDSTRSISSKGSPRLAELRTAAATVNGSRPTCFPSIDDPSNTPAIDFDMIRPFSHLTSYIPQI